MSTVAESIDPLVLRSLLELEALLDATPYGDPKSEDGDSDG